MSSWNRFRNNVKSTVSCGRVFSTVLALVLIFTMVLSGAILVACNPKGNGDAAEKERAAACDALRANALAAVNDAWTDGLSDEQIVLLPDAGKYVLAVNWTGSLADFLKNSALQTEKIKRLADFLATDEGKQTVRNVSGNIDGLINVFNSVGFTSADAQSLVMMSALFGVAVDTLVRGGVEAMDAVEARERRSTQVSYAAAAGIGLLGSAVVAPALLPELGMVGGVLSLAPLAIALAVARISRARSHADASLSVLREALESNVTLRLCTQDGPRDLTAAVLDERDGRPYLIHHTASVPRGERWEIVDTSGRRVARVAYRIILTGAPLPSIEARIEGVGTVHARKNLRPRAGLAEVWELDGCGVGILGDWLGDQVELLRDDRPVANVELTGQDAVLRIPRGHDAPLAPTLAFLLALARSEEHHS